MISDGTQLGVLLPCRNEAAVIARKLENLARSQWPASEAPHVVLVIDDHSTDDTLARARGLLDSFGGLPFELKITSNALRPGKIGALEHGLAWIGDSVDLLVLSDADVMIESTALLSLAAAFLQNARLGMASGTQVFVDTLDDLNAARSAAAGWDRWTAHVRRFESRYGVLFSVHGQLLAWRRALELKPRARVAADDVGLMLQVRGSATPEVRMVEGARFYEEKKTATDGGREQALRRARAWFQVFEDRARPAGFEGLRALQWFAYSRLPACLPWIVGAVSVMLVAAAFALSGPRAALVAFTLLVLCAASPFGREWLGTLGTIIKARRLERREALEEQWETTRN